MRLTAIGCVVGLAVGFTAAAATGQDSGGDAGEATIEAADLPVSLERIKRRLAALPETDDRRNLLQLSAYVDVYGRAPAIEFLRNFNVESGPLSYGSPTHAEMIEASTPRQWRPRAISISDIFRRPWRR